MSCIVHRRWLLLALSALLGAGALALLLPRWLDHPTIPAHTTVYIVDGARISALDPRTGKLLWRAPLNGQGTGAVLAGGMVYSGGSAGYVHAFDAATGATRWSVKITDIEPPLSVTVDRSVVYVGTCCPDVNATTHPFALCADTRVTLWSRALPCGNCAQGAYYTGSGVPAEGGAELIVPLGGTHAGSLDAVRASDGAVLWHATLPGAPNAPVLVGDTVYVSTDGGYVFAFNVATGAQRWRYQPPNFEVGVSSLAASGGLIYVCARRTFYALRATDGSLRWQITVPGSSDRNHQQYAPAVVNGTLYAIANNDETVYALDPSSGDIRWQFDGIGYGVAMPVVDRGVTYVATGDGGLVALWESDGKLITRLNLDLFDVGPIAVRGQ